MLDIKIIAQLKKLTNTSKHKYIAFNKNIMQEELLFL